MAADCANGVDSAHGREIERRMERLRARIGGALGELEREGHLDAAQRELVARRLDQVLHRPRGLDFATVVASFGGLLVAAGLLYLAAYNWEQLSKPLKLGLAFGAWFALHLVGWLLAERPGKHPALGRAFTLAGVLAFGGAIGVVAQVYHLHSHYPNAILLWWSLTIPIALVTNSRAILTLVLALFLTWAVWHLGVWIEDLPGPASGQVFLANFVLVGLAIGGGLQALATLAARGPYAHFNATLRLPILPLVAAAPFALAFHQPWWRDSPADLAAGALLPVAGTSACAAALLAWAGLRRGFAATRDGWILLGLVALLGGTVLLAPKLVPIVGNLVLFGGALALVGLGLAEASGNLASWGIFLFVVGVLARYFEYLWEKLEGAYAFLATGLLLMAAAYVFANRRRAVAARLGGRTP